VKIDISNLVPAHIVPVEVRSLPGPTRFARVFSALPLGFFSTCAANDNGLFSQAFGDSEGYGTPRQEPQRWRRAQSRGRPLKKFRPGDSVQRESETEDELSAFTERIAELEDEGIRAMRWKY